jgi:tetratricopeptide (TPR) repeat protein
MIDEALELWLMSMDALMWPLGDTDWLPIFSTGDPPELSRVYHSASRDIEKDPSNVQAHFTRAVVCQSKRWYPQALADVNAILTRDPQHARAWLLLSEVLASLGEYDRAKTARQRALQLDPHLA